MSIDDRTEEQDGVGDPSPGIAAPRMVQDLQPLAGRDNFAIWAEQASWMATSTLIDEAARPDFSVFIETAQFGEMNLSETRLSHPIRLARSADLITRSGFSLLLLQMFEEGHARGVHHDRHFGAQAGDVLILDFALPFASEVWAGRVIGLLLPRKLLPPALRTASLHGRVLSRHDGAHRLLTDHLRAVRDVLERLTVAQGAAACQAAAMLLEGALAGEQDQPRLLPDEGQQTLDSRARRYIEDHLADRKLGVASIAEALRLSRSTLYRLFERDGGVRPFISERRLLRAHEIISGDLASESGLGRIAFEQGFVSEAHFSRAFKQRFGIAPRDLRKAARTQRENGDGLPLIGKLDGLAPRAVAAKR